MRVISIRQGPGTKCNSPWPQKQDYEAHIIDVQPIGVVRVCLDDAGSGPAWTVWVHMLL
jgi:hypothetical protein